MSGQREEIWECDAERGQLWSVDPKRAAMLAYLEVVALWHDQVRAGVYWGVPALHRLPGTPTPTGDLEPESSTMRSRPARYTRDNSAGQWLVPGEIRRRWLAVA